MPLNQGQVIYNRYRIARLLGQGGMGAVYRAWDLNLNVAVALKEMVPEPGIDPGRLSQLRNQFQREAQVLAGLAHPNLPRVTDFFQWEGNAYLVMDFVDGESLSNLIERQGTLPESSVVSWALQLLDALTVCHHRNVVHRDIKPQNIIIRPDGQAILVDFGLVKLWDPQNPQTQMIVRGMGTREYASPEHFSLGGRHTAPSSDLYGLGATLYHAMTGSEPPSAMTRWADRSCFVPPRELGARVRPQVEAIILRSMALQPNERFSTAREMRASLQAAAGIAPDPRQQFAAPIHVAPVAGREAALPVPTVRSSRWVVEMVTAAMMAVVGMLTLQIVLFARIMTPGLYIGRIIGALLAGGLGWFIGDLIFQALAKPEVVAATSGGAGRPTQRLVALTRRMTRGLSTFQQIALLVVLLVGAAVLVWLFGPLVARVWWIWSYISFYALIGPLAYAASGRKPWRTLIAHTLVTTVGGALLGLRLGIGEDFLPLLLAAAVGGLLMEGVAFLSERLLIKSRRGR
jgi:serine/threonine-protein kinase